MCPCSQQHCSQQPGEEAPSSGRQDGQWAPYCSETLSPSRRKDVLTHAVTWLNPEDIRLSEASQSQRLLVLSGEGLGAAKCTGIESSRETPRCVGVRSWCLTGVVSVSQDEKFCGWMVVTSRHSMPRHCTLKTVKTATFMCCVFHCSFLKARFGGVERRGP